MSGLTIRRATQADVGELVELRREFSFEDVTPSERVSRRGFDEACAAFLTEAIAGGRWHIWVAELDARIVSHAFVALVDKVPRPVPEHSRIAYLTNMYTRPEFRRRGIGAELVRRAQEAAREADVELMFVWPSEQSADFYARAGFAVSDEPLVWNAERLDD